MSMTQLDQLPADHRAVLSLLLRQGKSYREVAGLLHIDESTVAERAQAALEGLGPRGVTGLSEGRRGELGDYLLGQQSASDRSSTREFLQGSASGRAWARVVSSELSPLAANGMPELPAERGNASSVAAERPARPGAVSGGAGRRSGEPLAFTPASAAPASTDARPRGEYRQAARVSRRGGALLLAGLGVVLAAVVVLILSSGGGSSKNTGSVTSSTPAPTASSPASPTPTPGGTSAPGATTAPVPPSTPGATTPPAGGAGQPTPVGQVRLAAVHGGSALAVANVYRRGAQHAFAILAQGLPAAPARSYAVWLYNSESDSLGLGLVPAAVGADGRFQVVGPVPTNAAHFRQMIVTRERTATPKHPGTILLEGPLTLSG